MSDACRRAREKSVRKIFSVIARVCVASSLRSIIIVGIAVVVVVAFSEVYTYTILMQERGNTLVVRTKTDDENRRTNTKMCKESCYPVLQPSPSYSHRNLCAGGLLMVTDAVPPDIISTTRPRRRRRFYHSSCVVLASASARLSFSSRFVLHE